MRERDDRLENGTKESLDDSSDFEDSAVQEDFESNFENDIDMKFFSIETKLPNACS